MKLTKSQTEAVRVTAVLMPEIAGVRPGRLDEVPALGVIVVVLVDVIQMRRRFGQVMHMY